MASSPTRGHRHRHKRPQQVNFKNRREGAPGSFNQRGAGDKWARQRRLTTSTASRWRTGNSSVRIIGKGHTGQEHGHAPTTLTVRRLATELSTLNARRRPCRVTSLHNAHHNTHSHLDTTAFAAELCEPAHTLTDRARRTSNPHASRTIHSDDVHSGPRRTTASAGDSDHKPEKQARRDQPPGNTPTQS
jgi:hypothetical protein